MKTALKIISSLTFLAIFLGIFTRGMEGWIGKLFPAGLALFAFLWVPFFLFYRYDTKQQANHSEEPGREDS